MGAVFVADRLYDAFMQGPESVIEFFHGYTYSGHPVACAAALATQQIYQQENLFQKAIDLEPYWQEALFGLRDLPNVIDIRTVGLVAGISSPPMPMVSASAVMRCSASVSRTVLLVRASGDTIALSPALIVEGRDRPDDGAARRRHPQGRLTQHCGRRPGLSDQAGR